MQNVKCKMNIGGWHQGRLELVILHLSFCILHFPSPAPSSVIGLILRCLAPKTMSRDMDEYVLQRGLAEGDRFNLLGECLDKPRDPLVAIGKL
jgi:hypothetical protein